MPSENWICSDRLGSESGPVHRLPSVVMGFRRQRDRVPPIFGFVTDSCMISRQYYMYTCDVKQQRVAQAWSADLLR